MIVKPTLAMLLVVFAATTGAADPGARPAAHDAEFFGRLDMSGFASPQLVNPKPVVADPAARGAAATPQVFHVRPGDERRWQATCKAYDGCAVPALFVTEAWFQQVYLPQVGGQDGREQRYREHARRDRVFDRDTRHKHPGE